MTVPSPEHVSRASARLAAALTGAALLLAACDETGAIPEASPPPEPTVVSQSEPFPFPNSRVISRPGDTTAVVEVRSLSNVRPNSAQLLTAARQFCGGDAIVGLPISTDRMRFNTIRQYLVRCQ